MIRYKCAKCGEPMESPDRLSGQHETCSVCKFENTVPAGATGVVRRQSTTTRYSLAIAVCVSICFAYAVIGVLLGWRHGGGIIPLMLLLAALGSAWRGITKSKSIARRHVKKLFITLGALVFIFLVSILLSVVLREKEPQNSPLYSPTLQLPPLRPQIPLPPPNLKYEWQRVEIPGIGTIDIPPVMEVQAASMRNLVKDVTKEVYGLTSSGSAVTIQQRGLNARDPEAFKSYVRITVKTETCNPGEEVGTLDADLGLTDSDISELQSSWEAQIRLIPRIQVLDFYRPTVERVNGMQAVCISYKRSLDKNPPVFVKMYAFQNYDRTHWIDMSYRVAEEDRWSKYFPAILESFRITNICK